MGLGVALLLLLAVVIVSYGDWRAWQTSRQERDTMQSAIQSTNTLVALIADAETGQRGYLITGDPRYLEPYHWATSRIPVEFLKLNEAVASDESRPLSLDLRARTDTKLKELERIIHVRKAGKVAEAFEMVRTNRGKQEMDAIRRVARRLSELESSKLEDQVERSRRREDRSRLLSMSGCGIIFVLLLFATRTIRRTGTQREQLILQLATSRDEINRSRDSAEATLKSIGDGVIATDERGRITLLNTVAEQLTGWNSHDAHGMMLDDVFCVVDESTRQPLESAVAKVLREGLAIGFANHSVLRSRDGVDTPIDHRGTPIRGRDGELRGVVLVFRDVTQRKLAQRQLENSERLYYFLFEHNPEPMWLYDAETLAFLAVNNTAVQIYGYSREEFLGMTIQAIRPFEDVPALMENVRQTGLTEFSRSGPWKHKKKDGTLIDVEITSHSITYQGRLARFVMTVDVTERKRAEEERQMILMREKEAREDAELLNRIGPLLSSELDEDRLIQSLTDLSTQLTNAQYGAFFYTPGTEQGDLANRYALSGASRTSFEGFPMLRSTPLFSATFDKGKIVRAGDVSDHPNFAKNPPFFGMPEGHVPVKSYLAVPVSARTGEVFGALLFGHPEKQIFGEREEQLASGIASQAGIALDNARLFESLLAERTSVQRHAEELARTNADLQQFALSASHDLQEPLRTVSIYAELLHRKASPILDGSSTEYLGYILYGARQMSALTADLLVYTEILSDDLRDVARTGTRQVLEEVLLKSKAAAEVNETAFTIGDLPPVRVRHGHLFELFDNLISNALKYRDEASPEIRIWAEREAKQWLFSVQDNGVGIDPEYQDQIFGLFKRLHGQKFPGTGMGLAICKRIVERYGGKIWVESQQSQGAIFRFLLPD